MPPYYRVSILLLLSLFGSQTAVSKEDTTMNKEENNVVGSVEAMTSAFSSRDIGRVLASYENNAVVIPEPGVKLDNVADIKTMFEGAFQIKPEFSYPNGHEVYVSNGLALHIAPWEMEGVAPDGTIIKSSGLSVAVLRKQSNGSWLLVIDNPHGQTLLNK